MKKKSNKKKAKPVTVKDYYINTGLIVLGKQDLFSSNETCGSYMTAFLKFVKEQNKSYAIIPLTMLHCFELKHGYTGEKLTMEKISKKVGLPKSTASYYVNAAACVLAKFYRDMKKYNYLYVVFRDALNNSQNLHGF